MTQRRGNVEAASLEIDPVCVWPTGPNSPSPYGRRLTRYPEIMIESI